MKSSEEQMDRIGRYLSGEISSEEMIQLEKDMLADEQLRKDFLAYARMDAALPTIVSEGGSLLDLLLHQPNPNHSSNGLQSLPSWWRQHG